MNINKLNKLVTIEKNTGNINDGGGNLVPNWQPVATVWAGVNPVNGYERTVAEQVGQEITHNVSMRYRSDITKERHRINYKGRILTIEYVINVEEKNVELKLECKEGER